MSPSGLIELPLGTWRAEGGIPGPEGDHAVQGSRNPQGPCVAELHVGWAASGQA